MWSIISIAAYYFFPMSKQIYTYNNRIYNLFLLTLCAHDTKILQKHNFSGCIIFCCMAAAPFINLQMFDIFGIFILFSVT